MKPYYQRLLDATHCVGCGALKTEPCNPVIPGYENYLHCSRVEDAVKIIGAFKPAKPKRKR